MADRTIVKQADHAILYSDGTILVKGVRASYPHLFQPFKGDDANAKAKFGMVGLMPKTKEYFPAKDIIRDHIRDMIRANKISDLKADAKFLRDGDLAGREESKGMYTINASEIRRPSLRDCYRDPKTGKSRVLQPGVTEDEDRIYPGCWVNILIRPWWQNNKFGKKVNAGLVAVQFVADDEPFGIGRVSEAEIDDTFDDFADDDSGFEDELGAEDDL